MKAHTQCITLRGKVNKIDQFEMDKTKRNMLLGLKKFYAVAIVVGIRITIRCPDQTLMIDSGCPHIPHMHFLSPLTLSDSDRKKLSWKFISSDL